MGDIVQFKRKQAKAEPQDVDSFGYGDALIDWAKALDGMCPGDTAPKLIGQVYGWCSPERFEQLQWTKMEGPAGFDHLAGRLDPSDDTVPSEYCAPVDDPA